MLIRNKIRLSVNVTMIEAWEANIGGAEQSWSRNSTKINSPSSPRQLPYFKTKIMFSFYNFTVCQQYEEFRSLDTETETETETERLTIKICWSR